RYIYLTFGGCVLAVVSMGPYCLIVLLPTVLSVVLIHSLCAQHIHSWVFLTQMSWQSFWHFTIQYKEYWLQEPSDTRLLIAVSSLMLLTQRVTSLSMDIQEGKLRSPHSGTQSSAPLTVPSWLPYLSYTLYFPALLGGPLCSFSHFKACVEQISLRPPRYPLGAMLRKFLLVVSLEGAKKLLRTYLLENVRSPMPPSVLGNIVLMWTLSLWYKMSYYSHWALSEALNNTAGLGFRGYSSQGTPLWDGLSDSDIWALETSSRLSDFARMWNKTTTIWLRRLVFQKSPVNPLLLTFGFSALWHGLHPGQVVGFLGWAATVEADYRVHHYISPQLGSTVWRLLYKSLSWAQTQLVIACVILTVELRCLSSIWLLYKTSIGLFPLIYCVALLVLPRKQHNKKQC
ncbi:MBOA4 acyltransferase, partial [Amia calva]|nr:MBOA4 acyltransferase [Amia calva]